MPAGVVNVLDRHLGVSDADLRIMGWTRSGLAARKVALALTGLLLPPLLSLMFSARGVTLPVSIPVIASVALAGWMWIPLIVVAMVGAWRCMDNLSHAKADFASTAEALREPHLWLMSLLYIGGESAQIELQLPSAITGLFQGLLLFYLLAADLFIHYRFKPRAPAASNTPLEKAA